MRTAVDDLVLPSDTADQKLRKIYTAIMALENTNFTREHTTSEDKAAGLKEANSTDDILLRKRGTGDQLTALCIAMARAAGLKAYVIAVANRKERIFLSSYLSMNQLNDDLALSR